MKHSHHYYISILILFFCYSCEKETLLTNKIGIVLEKDTLLTVKNWCQLGPFALDSTKTLLERHSSNILNEDVKEITSINEFIELCKAITVVDSTKIWGMVNMPKYMLTMSFDNKAWVPPATSFIACSIESPQDTSVVLALSAYQACDLWLNGELCYSVEWKRGPNKFREEYIPISLKKGSNFILMKTSLVDVKTYNYTQWKVLVNIVNDRFGKELFENDYARYFIRRSMLDQDNSILKIYTGPYSASDKLTVEIRGKNNEVIHKKEHEVSTPDGLITIDMKKYNSSGFHICDVEFENRKYTQSFFYGDVDNYLDSLLTEYNQQEIQSHELQLDIEALIQRIHIDKRRGKDVLDDIAEYWDGLRVPSLQKLEQTIIDIKKGVDPTANFFLHSFYSETLKRDYFYSAYIPSNIQNKMPVFFMVDPGGKDFTEDWRSHWRNEVYGTENLCALADKYRFVIVWSDCGGGDDSELRLKIFEEILDNVKETLPVDTNTYVIGNCATTNLALYLCANTSRPIRGCGLINPVDASLPMGLEKKDINLAMLSAYHDEETPFEMSNKLSKKLEIIDPKMPFFIDYMATHHKSQANYMEPIFKHFIDNNTLSTN